MKLLGMIILIITFFSFLMGKVKWFSKSTKKASLLFLLLTCGLFILGGCQAASSTDEQPVSQEKEGHVTKQEQEKESSNDEISQATTAQNEGVGELAVHFVDVGQGAAQVIITPSKKVMVIDAGNNDDEEKMVEYLKQLAVSKVDVVIGTHPDADHIGGLDAVIDAFDIGKIYMPKVERDTQTFASVLQSIQNKGLKVTTAKAGIALDVDPAISVNMISPVDNGETDANEQSAVVKIQYGEQSFLLTGDAGIKTEEKWLKSGIDLTSTVLLTGHHGSNHSTSEAFLQAVDPEYAVIQVGKNNYGHPTSEVLERLTKHHIKIYRNDTDGTIVFKTDGKEMKINKQAWQYEASELAVTDDTQTTSDVITPTIAEKEAAVVNHIAAQATIDQVHPNQNEEVTVTVTVKDENNQPINGANVHLNLQFKSKDTVYEAVTNANGVATLSFRVGRAASGFTVNGDITVTANRVTAVTHTAFTPK